MISTKTARAALDPLWQAMVELAEGANESVIGAQRKAPSKVARTIGDSAADLAALAHAAAVLARATKRAPA